MIPANTPSVGQFSFQLKQGADTSICMTWLDDNGAPMNLTGYAMKMSIKPFINSTAIKLTISSADSSGSFIELGATAGTITLNFAHDDTAALQANGLAPNGPLVSGGGYVVPLGVYDLQYVDPSGKIGYLLEGEIGLDLMVTQ